MTQLRTYTACREFCTSNCFVTMQVCDEVTAEDNAYICAGMALMNCQHCHPKFVGPMLYEETQLTCGND